MKIAAIAFSDQGMVIGERLQQSLTADETELTLTRACPGRLAAWTAEQFQPGHALLFIGATGIAVRAIASLVKSKSADPAVIVMDDAGQYAISLLSGHLGGANELALRLARAIAAIPVITTATDIHGVFAIDNWARRQKLTIVNPERIKWVSARLLTGETVRLKSFFPVLGALPPGLILDENEYDALITYRNRGRQQALRLVPPVITLGVGCKKGVDAAMLEEALARTLAKASCHPQAICRVCSIDLKATEPGLLEFCRNRSLPLQTFAARELAAVKGNFSGSDFVRQVAGVDNVCERSAVLGSGGELLSAKNAGNGVAMALAIAPYEVDFEVQS